MRKFFFEFFFILFWLIKGKPFVICSSYFIYFFLLALLPPDRPSYDDHHYTDLKYSYDYTLGYDGKFDPKLGDYRFTDKVLIEKIEK